MHEFLREQKTFLGLYIWGWTILVIAVVALLLIIFGLFQWVVNIVVVFGACLFVGYIITRG